MAIDSSGHNIEKMSSASTQTTPVKSTEEASCSKTIKLPNHDAPKANVTTADATIFSVQQEHMPTIQSDTALMWSDKDIDALQDLEALLGSEPALDQGSAVNGENIVTAQKASVVFENCDLFVLPQDAAVTDDWEMSDVLATKAQSNHNHNGITFTMADVPDVSKAVSKEEREVTEAKNGGGRDSEVTVVDKSVDSSAQASAPVDDVGAISHEGLEFVVEYDPSNPTKAEEKISSFINAPKSSGRVLMVKNKDTKDLLAIGEPKSKTIRFREGTNPEIVNNIRKQFGPEYSCIYVDTNTWSLFQQRLEKLIHEKTETQETQQENIREDNQNIKKFHKAAVDKNEPSLLELTTHYKLQAAGQLIEELKGSILNKILLEEAIEKDRKLAKEKQEEDQKSRQLSKELAHEELKIDLLKSEINKRVIKKEEGIPPEFNIGIEKGMQKINDQIHSNLKSE